MERTRTVNNDRGFTLIELIITVAIIGIISAIAIPAYRNYVATAKTSAAQTILAQFPILLENYQAEKGTFPPDGDYDYKQDASGAVTVQTIKTGAGLTDFTPQTQSSGGAIMFDIHLNIANSGAVNQLATFTATGVREGAGIFIQDTYPK